jgi:hydrogenase nickel incorporation protein HypA/HybF
MHELTVTESILNIAVDYATKSEANRVTDIHLQIGRLSSFIDDSIQFYWDMISKGTICEKAVIHFDRFPAEIECLACGTIYQMDRELTPCPECKSIRIKILSGDEFRVESIEIIKVEG